MTIDTSSITHIVATIGAIAAAGYTALPLLFWKQKLNLDTLHTVATIAEKVVAAIEQTQSGALGNAKKALALSNMESILSSLGVNVPEPFINAALEAAVLALGGNGQSPPPPAGGGAPTASPAAVTTTYAWDASGNMSSASTTPSPEATPPSG